MNFLASDVLFAIGGINVVALLGGLWQMHRIATRIERTFDYFMQEHELLMIDYAERHNIELSDLATRVPKPVWWTR